MGKLDGKVAVITGGTTGIGLATAKLFHEEGAKVVVTGTNPNTLEKARQELEGIAKVVSSDSGDPAQIRDLFARLKQDFGGIDVLFLNAGILRNGPIATMDEKSFDDVFRVNVKGPWFAIQAAIPMLRPGGAIVLNGSINAHIGMQGAGAYAATKAALRSIGRTAAAELADQGIRVNTVSPGPTDTGIIEKSFQDRKLTEQIQAGLIAKIPQKRLGTSEEIARAVLFLASDDSSFMTGEEIILDGGMTRV